ncbi:DUF3592 domain-containing protein [Streptomyces sp. NPDC091371]|uniref:DUF3592 domain-containing protein n=1 Tax=Streptomyces sp. NPDC091371 TaxID=3155303 RepID=UPI003433678F
MIGFVLAVTGGLLCLWGGVRETRLQARLRRYGVRTEGVVVDQKTEPADDYPTPVIEFTDGRGLPVRFMPVSTGTGMGMGMDLGTRVRVVYLPEQPQNARVSTRKHRRAHVSLFAGSALFLGSAVWVWLTR